MMLFKLSFKNIRKSVKDYSIFFCTLVIGIAIFYVFNAIEKQTVMIDVKAAKYDVIGTMNSVLSAVSIFVSVVLGLLIVYASSFLIKRRKKEFGTYMILGMKKRNIATIMFGETMIIGVISLVVGLLIGVIASQGMSIFVASLFEADMSSFKFIVSKEAISKTIIYFAIMYLIVIIFDMFVVGKAKLINLLTASKKSEKNTNKNIIVCLIVFIISGVILGTAYYNMVYNMTKLDEMIIYLQMAKGIVGTFTLFWSLSGIVIFIAKRSKSFYYRGVHCFSTKEISSRVNSNICSASLICLMMFFTICLLSSGFSIRNSLNKNLRERVTKDVIIKYDLLDYSELKNPVQSAAKVLENRDKLRKEFNSNSMQKILDKNNLSDLIIKDFDIWTYSFENFTSIDITKGLSEDEIALLESYSAVAPEVFMHVSDYNKVALAYGTKQYSLEDDEYIVMCDYPTMKQIRDKGLKGKPIITLNNKQYKPKYDECKEGYIEMSDQSINMGLIIVPDSLKFDETRKETNIIVGNYNKEFKYPNKYDSLDDYVNSEVIDIFKKDIYIDFRTKTQIKEKAVGLVAMVIFIAIYIGIIFMISSAAILALKSLSDATDNAHKYLILRRIGVSERMLHKSLFIQSLIFFGMPITVAVVHSIYGIKFSKALIYSMGLECSNASIIFGVLLMLGIYLLYFIITYFTSRKIIDEKK